VQANALFHRPGGVLDLYDTAPFDRLISAGVSPLLCGDVLVEGPGSFRIVSSDKVVVALAGRLPVSDCVFATDVDGVWDSAKQLIPAVTVPNRSVSASDRRDVTGGMSAKIGAALEIAATGARTTIVNGRVRGRVRDALNGRAVIGTRVTCPAPRPVVELAEAALPAKDQVAPAAASRHAHGAA
jgi:isopentenyl phosphate kinase